MTDTLRPAGGKAKGKKQKAKGKRTGWSFRSSEMFRLDPFAFCLLLFAFCLSSSTDQSAV
ncbi:MAG: hypothetical protein SF182_12645 [Deltaproteobacteria bacterium]|nr:hypothetical protein [Deltaproteobacteria bacterium]